MLGKPGLVRWARFVGLGSPIRTALYIKRDNVGAYEKEEAGVNSKRTGWKGWFDRTGFYLTTLRPGVSCKRSVGPTQPPALNEIRLSQAPVSVPN
jgi:hypothetical protein